MQSRDVLTAWGQLREQWRESRLVRTGVWLATALLAIYLLLAGFDAVDRMVERNQTRATELARMKALAKETDWPQRGREAVGLKAAYDTTVWMDPDIALTEANLQDWLRNVTQRLGLKVREITLVRAEPGTSSASKLPEGYVEVRARLSVELQRTALFTLLAEMATQERRIVVDRLVIKSQNQPATAEIDVRIVARPGTKP